MGATSVRDRVMLDRYAIRDIDGKASIGDTVIVSLKRPSPIDGKEKESREIGVITHATNSGTPSFTIKLKDDNVPEDDWEVLSDFPRDRFEKIVEKSWFDICDRIVESIAHYEPEEIFLNQLSHLLKEEAFVPAGRILAGLGRTDLDLTLFNCFVKAIPEDSRGGISIHFGNLFEIFSRGGGCGFNASILRPRGAPVRGVNGRSSGVCSWISHFARISTTVEQGGSRRGASIAILEVWHPDVLEFAEFKSKLHSLSCPHCKGEIRQQENEWEGCNVSIGITNDFMKAVINDDDWKLVFPKTDDPEYNELWDGDLKKWYRRGKRAKVFRVLPARELWEKLVHYAWSCGDPGLLFIDRANELSNSYYYNRIISTNPCVTGDTPIFTEKGIFTVGEMQGPNFKAVQDARMSDPVLCQAKQFFSTGKKKTYRLQTMEGYFIKCTANHRVLTSEGWKRADELEQGDTLHILNREGCFGEIGSPELGYVLGWLVADGGISEDCAILDFYDTKKILAQEFAEYTFSLVDGLEKSNRSYGITPSYIEKTDKYTFSSVRLRRLCKEYGVNKDNLRKVPAIVRHGTFETQQAFLRAVFTADGTFNDGGEKGASVRLDSISPELLEGVQLLLLNFGIASKIYWDRRKAGYRKLPDGKGSYKEYWCEAQHTLTISKRNLILFKTKIGFLLDYKTEALNSYLDGLTRGPYRERFLARFESFTYEGVEEVYDTTVHQTHAYISGGLVSHNCGEICLPVNGLCNLGHINLSKFVLQDAEQFPDVLSSSVKALDKIDFDKLKKAVSVGVRFMDNVLDANVYHDPDMEDLAKKERRIGLGILGYAELLMRVGLRYGSEQAAKFTTKLMSFFRDESYKTSTLLAKEKGSFPGFDKDKYLNGKFIQSLPEEVRFEISKHGIRNVTLNTIAPTGSVGTMVGTSTGCEPYIAYRWKARSRIGTTTETINIWEEMEARFGPYTDRWPSYAVVADELTPLEHIGVQGLLQQYIDASISKTVNLPNSATVEDVGEAFMAMWEKGCKGGTVYRDGSKLDGQVLYKEEITTSDLEIDDRQEISIEILSQDASDPMPMVPLLRPRIESGLSLTVSKDTPIGTMHNTIRFHPVTGEPYDYFCTSGKGDVGADAQALGRLISVILRWPDNVAIPQGVRLQIVMGQLDGILGRGQVGIGPNAVHSLPDGISKFFKAYLEGQFPLAGLPMGEEQLDSFARKIQLCKSKADIINLLTTGSTFTTEPESKKIALSNPSGKAYSNLEYCPQCGNATLIKIPGHCVHCTNQQCDYEEC